MHTPTHHPFQTDRHPYGGSLLPVLIILVALGISAAIFFYNRSRSQPPAPPVTMVEPAEKTLVTPPPPSATDPVPPKPATPPPSAPPAFGFARAADVGRQMLQSLAAGDFATAGKLASAAQPAQAESATAVLKKLVAEMGLKPGMEDDVEILGTADAITRISVPLLKPGSSVPLRLQLDLMRDERMGWKVAAITLPKELSSALAAMPAPPAPDASAPPATSPGATPPASATAMTAKTTPLFKVEEVPDALTFASDFVQALLRHDFTAARDFVDATKVPVERLAGLCIVFEEGQYELKPGKPLILTVANPQVSWVIAQVQSQPLQQATEFGLEMKRASLSAPWQITGLNLSDILGSFAASATKLGIPYTPIVRSPKGGESLALYFEYDQAQLHPRAQKQLEIIAGLLKSDASRKLTITGHTDAKGADDYNLRLSQARAQSVKQQLVAMGVPEAQVNTTGMGKAMPLGPNRKADGTDDPEGRSKNRRAEIFLDF